MLGLLCFEPVIGFFDAQKYDLFFKQASAFRPVREKGGLLLAGSPLFDAGNYSLLNYFYVNGLFAFGTRANFELYDLTFVE
ncbi:MAG: hypothetical protein V8Q54_10885 [Alistipes senegalensis]